MNAFMSIYHDWSLSLEPVHFQAGHSWSGSGQEFNRLKLKGLYRCVRRTYIFPIAFHWENFMSVYFIPLFTLPVIINELGEYLTRGGDRVKIDRASTRHEFGCVGSYVACGTAEKWHMSGRILATSETKNDIVRKASSEGAQVLAQAETSVADQATTANAIIGVQAPHASWEQKIRAIKRAAEAVGPRAVREVHRNLAEGVEHMEYKDYSEFDCSCEQEYIFGEAFHLIEELRLPFDEVLKIVMTEDSQVA